MMAHRNVNGDDSEVKKKGLMDKFRGVRNGLSDRIPQQHKDTAHDHLNRGKQFLTEEYFPEERRVPRQAGIVVLFLVLTLLRF
jgi:hypothetical protein